METAAWGGVIPPSQSGNLVQLGRTVLEPKGYHVQVRVLRPVVGELYRTEPNRYLPSTPNYWDVVNAMRSSLSADRYSSRDYVYVRAETRRPLVVVTAERGVGMNESARRRSMLYGGILIAFALAGLAFLAGTYGGDFGNLLVVVITATPLLMILFGVGAKLLLTKEYWSEQIVISIGDSGSSDAGLGNLAGKFESVQASSGWVRSRIPIAYAWSSRVPDLLAVSESAAADLDELVRDIDSAYPTDPLVRPRGSGAA